jgi:hypothetical protein
MRTRKGVSLVLANSATTQFEEDPASLRQNRFWTVCSSMSLCEYYLKLLSNFARYCLCRARDYSVSVDPKFK